VKRRQQQQKEYLERHLREKKLMLMRRKKKIMLQIQKKILKYLSQLIAESQAVSLILTYNIMLNNNTSFYSYHSS